MNGTFRLFLLIFFILGLLNHHDGQTRQELEKERHRIIKDIEKTSKALQNTQKTKELNQHKLKALEAQVDSRKKLISNLQSEVKMNQKLLSDNTTRLEKLNDKHLQLKSQYNHILRQSYLKKLTNSKWSYLLSSTNLNHLIIRWRYIHQFDAYTKQKVEEIKAISGEILVKNEEIEKTKVENLATMQQTTKNMTLLEKEQKAKDELVKKLSKEEDNLRVKLKKREVEREKLNKEIEKIIIAALSKAKENEKKDATVANKKEIDNSGFSKNKGALDWPITKGAITGRFGNHPHPSIKNVEVSNNGVDFTLYSNDQVVCIFDGEVVGKTEIPGFNNMVIIKHGSYYSVYSKLDQVQISKGQKIKRGQKIGDIFVGPQGHAELHFELWKDKTKLDPQKWFNR